jgi:predicted Zn-ribbon and HTH transcriptional regulator
MNDALHTALIKLRLSGLAQSLDVRLQEASGNHLNHVEFLELLLQDELAVRNERLAVVMIVIVVSRRRRVETILPRCGNCGYNLTGAPSNRCPECGKLFIEAGVITKPPKPLPSRGVIRILVLLMVGFTVLGVLGTIAMRVRVRTARARAVAARQAVAQARMRAQAAAQRAATTTAPATEGDSSTQPLNDP